MEALLHHALTPREVNAVSALGLAHMGDAVYEILVRSMLDVLGLDPASEQWRGQAGIGAGASGAAAAEHHQRPSPQGNHCLCLRPCSG